MGNSVDHHQTAGMCQLIIAWVDFVVATRKSLITCILLNHNINFSETCDPYKLHYFLIVRKQNKKRIKFEQQYKERSN
jgi:hypothetical protein